MKSKAPLALMEQMVMLLVFALAAALCLQAFVQSDRLSRESEARDHAAVLCQSVAETIRHNGGNLEAAAAQLAVPYGAYAAEGLPFEVHYTEDWGLSDTREYAYYLRAEEVDSGLPGLGQARVEVVETAAGEPLFDLTISWQKEVTVHG